jgi:hypothetical protein
VEAEEWIHDVSNGPRSLIYTILAQEPHNGGEIVGVIGLNRWDQVHIMIHPDVSGLGYATEALRAFLPALFQQQPKRLSIGTVVGGDNLASMRVLENCGFVPDVPKRSVGPPVGAEPSEDEEKKALEGIGYEPAPGEGTLFFRCVKPTSSKTLSAML